MPAAEILRFDDLAPYLLLRNGNFLYKVPCARGRDGFAVIKVYYGSRGALANLRKSAANLLFEGQTSYMPRTRRRIERECLATWRRHGFRVYETYDDVAVEAPACPPGGYTVFEHRSGPRLNDVMNDARRSPDERFAVYRAFVAEWARRHELAIEHAEPRLVHENGDGKHVLIFDDGLLWFDFEMIWRSRRRVPEQVSHEILQYLWHLNKSLPEALRERLLDETVAAYPRPERLRDACAAFLGPPRLLPRIGRALDRNLKRRARKPTSKYNVARKLRARL